MRVLAVARDVRITSRKARVVARSVIGLPVAEALSLLNFTPRHGAREVAKVIKSAVANAENNYSLETDSLRVERLEVEPAGIIKRYIAKPRGMAGSLFKRTSHLRCYVTDEEPEPERRRRSLVAMPGRTLRTSTRPAATRRQRPARLRRAQEAAAAAAAEGSAEAVPAEADAGTEGEAEASLAEAWGQGAAADAAPGQADAEPDVHDVADGEVADQGGTDDDDLGEDDLGEEDLDATDDEADDEPEEKEPENI
jgi:large subunit ribosomal protein L22